MGESPRRGGDQRSGRYGRARGRILRQCWRKMKLGHPDVGETLFQPLVGFSLNPASVAVWKQMLFVHPDAEAPLLLSGLALAGANRGLQGLVDENGNDGLLYSIEVLDLNLQGTERVSLSTCNTDKGVIDYSEGVYGLLRAFRTASASSVLMTLRSVGDRSSRDFLEKNLRYLAVVQGQS